jgi:DNA-binding NtrC family response regulator
MLFSLRHVSPKVTARRAGGAVMMSDPVPLNILIVEDEYFIADELARAVQEAGFAIRGPVATVEHARAVAAAERVDHVLLDLNLGGDSAVELANWFVARGTKVTIITGYESTELPVSLAAFSVVQKPISSFALLDVVHCMRQA